MLLNILMFLTQKIAITIAILISGILPNIFPKLYSCHKRAKNDTQKIFRNETIYSQLRLYIQQNKYITRILHKKSVISIDHEFKFQSNSKSNLNL